MKLFTKSLIAILTQIFGHGDSHPSTWMSLVSAYIDDEIYETVFLLNILGFKTIYSCQDLSDKKDIQFVIDENNYKIFEHLLNVHSISHKRYNKLLNGIGFTFDGKNHNLLLSLLNKIFNKNYWY